MKVVNVNLTTKMISGHDLDWYRHISPFPLKILCLVRNYPSSFIDLFNIAYWLSVSSFGIS